MAGFDKDKFAAYLDLNALPGFGQGKCAHYVRMALAAGDLRPITWPVSARLWGGTLLALGFTAVLSTNYSPQKGDIAVIQPIKSGDDGHIEGYDGKHWVSDFVQENFWPSRLYADKKPDFVVYRRVH